MAFAPITMSYKAATARATNDNVTKSKPEWSVVEVSSSIKPLVKLRVKRWTFGAVSEENNANVGDLTLAASQNLASDIELARLAGLNSQITLKVAFDAGDTGDLVVNLTA